MPTFAEQVITFNQNLHYKGTLPCGIRVMNPFRNNSGITNIMSAFYKKFYEDNNERRLILGINPGRFGAGVTGIPFVDTKRLHRNCGIEITDFKTHELSSVFVFNIVSGYGGTKQFFSDFYINSVCPLGFVYTNQNGKEVNYNYYDNAELYSSVKKFIVASIKQQLEFHLNQDVCYCLGTGSNYKFLTALNQQYSFFKKIIPLEHPRYIMQYKSKSKHKYIKKYLTALKDK